MRKTLMGISTATLLAGSAAPTIALETSLQYVLTLTGDIERRQVLYDCEQRDGSLPVEYVNAAPNFLAVVPVEGEDLIFVTTLSGSGARYVAGVYEWRTKGADASLHRITDGQDTPPLLTCLEINNIP